MADKIQDSIKTPIVEEDEPEPSQGIFMTQPVGSDTQSIVDHTGDKVSLGKIRERMNATQTVVKTDKIRTSNIYKTKVIGQPKSPRKASAKPVEQPKKISLPKIATRNRNEDAAAETNVASDQLSVATTKKCKSPEFLTFQPDTKKSTRMYKVA